MAKIAVELEQALARMTNGVPGHLATRLLAHGDGWSVADVVCTSGPQDHIFEECFSDVCIAIVVAGTFQYRAQNRSGAGCELMTPGSLLLGNTNQHFECGHEHGAGDRCLSFTYAPDYFERLAADAGARGARLDFRVLRLPPLRALSSLVAQACAGLAGFADPPWEELSVQLATLAIQLSGDLSLKPSDAPPAVFARVTRTVRMIEHDSDAGQGMGLGRLARAAGLSPYHFLRTFQRLTGMTPHQYVLRRRLREAAMRLAAEPGKILDIALDCGFGDVSNFNRAFRAEFGVNPRGFRSQSRREPQVPTTG